MRESSHKKNLTRRNARSWDCNRETASFAEAVHMAGLAFRLFRLLRQLFVLPSLRHDFVTCIIKAATERADFERCALPLIGLGDERRIPADEGAFAIA